MSSQKEPDPNSAKWKIIQAANKQRIKRYRHPRLYGMRDLQTCVAIVRGRNLVKPEVLVEAGFHPTSKHLRRSRKRSRG